MQCCDAAPSPERNEYAAHAHKTEMRSVRPTKHCDWLGEPALPHSGHSVAPPPNLCSEPGEVGKGVVVSAVIEEMIELAKKKKKTPV